jgi:hypothetical protein
MSWVDLVVLLLALVAGISGWRHGVAVALLSFVGVLGGAIIGVRVAPLLASGIDNPTTRVIVSVVVVVLLVALGETTGVFFGRRIRDRIGNGPRRAAPRRPVYDDPRGYDRGSYGRYAGNPYDDTMPMRHPHMGALALDREDTRRRMRSRVLLLDSMLGAVLQAVTVVIAAWLVALPLASASFPALAAGIRGSVILQTVDGVMPEQAQQLPDQLRKLLANSDFPDVLSPFAETPITEIGPPDPTLIKSPAVKAVSGSVLKIRGKAPSCGKQLEGSGFVIAPQLVLTNAHVVAGTSTTAVEVLNSRGKATDMPADVILYDPQTDIAVLRVQRSLDIAPLEFQPTPAKAGADQIVLGYPLDGPFTITPGRIRQNIKLKGPNIYDTGEVIRDVYTVRAKVRSGNSGGPMIDTAGKVTGVVFGAAVDDPETGFVLTVDQVAPDVQKAIALPSDSGDVDTGNCGS